MLKKVTKLFSLFVVAALALACLTVGVYADNSQKEIVTRYQYVMNAYSRLTISGTTATCESVVTGNSATKKIAVTQTLEKHVVLGIFSTVSGAEWSSSVYDDTLSLTNTKSGLGSGIYRVKSVFTVTTSGGKSETITAYSSEKTI